MTEEQLHEARAMRYVDAARVVRLADGTFVVFTMTSGEAIGSTVDPAELSILVDHACAESGASWERAKAIERELVANGAKVVKLKLTDMELEIEL